MPASAVKTVEKIEAGQRAKEIARVEYPDAEGERSMCSLREDSAYEVPQELHGR